MRPHPRIRKTVKWGGAVVSVLLVVVWIGSGWWAAGGDVSTRIHVSVIAGIVSVVVRKTPPSPMESPHWVAGRVRIPFESWFDWHDEKPFYGVTIPLWTFALTCILLTAVAWRLDTLARRRARIGLCPSCSYSRTGLAPNAVCPECGAAAPIAS